MKLFILGFEYAATTTSYGGGFGGFDGMGMGGGDMFGGGFMDDSANKSAEKKVMIFLSFSSIYFYLLF